MAPKALVHFDWRVKEELLEKFFAFVSPMPSKGMGKRMKEWRKTYEISQKKLAERLGITTTDVFRIEQGKKINNMPSMEIFKNAFLRDTEWLITGGSWLGDLALNTEYRKQIKKFFAVIE